MILNFIVESLEIGDSLVLVFQFALIRAHLYRVLCVLTLLRLEFGDLTGPKVGEDAMVTDDLLGLAEAPLESMHATNSNVVVAAPRLCSYSTVVSLRRTWQLLTP